MVLVTALVEESSKAVFYYTKIVSTSYNYLQWIETDLLIFIAYIVGLKKLAKVLILAQRLSKLAENTVAGEVGKGLLKSYSFSLLVISPPHTKRK